MAWNLEGRPYGDDDHMLRLLAPYEGQRWRVIRLLKLSGRRAPRGYPQRRRG